MRPALVLLFTAALAAAAEPLNILPETKIDLRPTPRDASEPIPEDRRHVLPLNDGKTPVPEVLPVLPSRRPTILGDQRFLTPHAWAAVAGSPDGKTIVAGVQSYGLRLFDAATGHETDRVFPEISHVTFLRFSPDGKRLFVANNHATVCVLDTVKKIEVARFFMDMFTLTPDAKVCAGIEWEDEPRGGRRDDKLDLLRRRAVIRVRTTADWKCVAAISLGDFQPKALALSPDGKLLAVGGSDGTVRVLDPKEEKEVAASEKLAGTIDLLEFHPNGKTVVAADRNQSRGSDAPHHVHLWDFGGAKKATTLVPTLAKDANLEEQRFGKLGGVSGFRLSADGNRLVSIGWDGTVRLWDTVKATMLTATKSLGYGPNAAFSPDGTRVLIGGGARLLPLSVPELKDVGLPAADPLKVPFELAGGLAKFDDRRKKFHDLPADEFLRDGGFDKPPYAGVELQAKGKVLHHFEPGRNVSWEVTPDNKTLICYGQNVDGQGFDYPIRFYDLATRKETAAIRSVPRPNFHIRLSPDGKLLAIPHTDGRVRVWDVATRKPLLELDADGHWVDRVTFSADGKKLVGGHDKSAVLLVWDLTEPKKK